MRLLLSLLVLLPAVSLARVIPPGQEDAIATALGRGVALPADCKWQGASVTPEAIQSQYLCGAQKVSLELKLRAEPNTAPPPGELREFTLSGAAPAELISALAPRLDRLQLELAFPTAVQSAPSPVSAGLVPRAAWVLLFLMLGALAFSSARPGAWSAEQRLSAGSAVLVFALALLLRLVVPWGPLDFAEPERIAALWGGSFVEQPSYSALPALFAPLQTLGLSPLTLYRFAGPLLGAATCALLVPLARAWGCSAPIALVAGLVLATWPVHVRYSAGANPGIVAAALWAAVLLVLTSKLAVWARLGLLLPLVVLCVHARPEGRFVVLALLPWLFSTTDVPRRAKVAFSALGLLVLIPWALASIIPQGSSAAPGKGFSILLETLLARGVTPDQWVLLGVGGWFLGKPHRPFARWSLAISVVMITLSAIVFGSEANRLWGHWRYLLPLMPFFALGSAVMLEALAQRLHARSRWVFGAAIVLALSPLLAFRHLLFRPIDLQEEFHFILRTAPQLPKDATVAFDVSAPDSGVLGTVNIELLPAMALGFARWPAQLVPSGPEVTLPEQARAVQGLRLFRALPVPVSPPFILYQGLSSRLRARRTVAPQLVGAAGDSVRLQVAPISLVNSQCNPELEAVEGDALRDCTVELGWYEVK